MTAIPADAKKPADRKAKKSAALEVEVEGVSLTIDREALNDYEVLELFDEVEDEPQKVTRLFRRIVGKEQHEALKDAVRGEDGRVDAERMARAFAKIVESLGN